MLKNSKSISVFAVVSALLLSVSAPAFGARLSCASGGSCAVGDIGPGGGTVYYFNRKGFNCGPFYTSTGSPIYGLCRYLEVAPSGWNGSVDLISWATGANQSTSVGTLLAIGTGYQNSLNILSQVGNVAATSAAVAARGYTGGPKTDWYLPSKDELNLLYQWKTKSRVPVPGIDDGDYWSSSESDAISAWLQYFLNGLQNAAQRPH